MKTACASLTFAIAMLISPLLSAHFVLLEPASWLVENERGDPQKLGPCGGTSADPGTPTNAIGKVRGGSTIHLKIKETIFHPGHYRVALAVNSRSELPADPEVVTRDSERGAWSVSSPIMSPVKAPVLADGLFPHTVKPTDIFEADVVLPNINCEKCTLQVVQFMAEHGYNKDGGYFYHHCADLSITANAEKAIDREWLANR